jgi:hypothetical protein
MKQKKIELTVEDYNEECNKIVAMGFPVNDTLVLLLDFAVSVKIISQPSSHE